jgi:hypothetical protein
VKLDIKKIELTQKLKNCELLMEERVFTGDELDFFSQTKRIFMIFFMKRKFIGNLGLKFSG